jgi:transaldolase
MRIFLDTANLDEIRTAARWGILAGVTTNPSLMAKEAALQGKRVDFKAQIVEICDIVRGPVSAEVTATDVDGMVSQAREIATWSPYVVVKIPITAAGLEAIHILSDEGINTNCTLIFSVNQALLAATAGATYVSPFLGRLDDIGHEGMQIVRDLADIFDRYGFETQIIAASLRHPLHVIEAAKAGADIATMPFTVLQSMLRHPLTDIGQERFLADWKKFESQK